jgi:hypothetical protein
LAKLSNDANINAVVAEAVVCKKFLRFNRNYFEAKDKKLFGAASLI